MKNLSKQLLACILLCTLAVISYAQSPVLRTYALPKSSVTNMSDNGLWAVAHGDNDSEREDFPYIIDVNADKAIQLISSADAEKGIFGSVFDITNDGMAVGSYNGTPATYKDGKWTLLGKPNKREASIYSVTPDGKYMVGYSEPWGDGGNYKEEPYLWIDGVYTACPGLPTVDILGEQVLMNRFLSISADGRYILGFLNFSYISGGIGAYLYDRTTQTYIMLGKGHLNDGEFIAGASMSNNGEWIAGTMLLLDDKCPNGEYIPYTYNVKTKEFTKYDDEDSYDTGIFAVANDGMILGCAPFVNPARTFKYRKGNFWYGLDTMLKERYNVDYNALTGYDYTGIPCAISDDCRTIAGMSVVFKNYVITLPESISEATNGVNLLSNYTISPAAGSTFNKASTFMIAFDRQANIIEGATKKIKLYEGDKEIATAISVKASASSSKTFQIGFIPKTLENGKTYVLKIAEGCFGIEGSDDVNKEINVSYVGRENKPVQPLMISIKEGSEQSELSYLQPLTIQFDIPVSVVAGKVGYLYQDDNEEPLSTLQLAVSGNYMAAYPTITQHLFLGSSYKIVIPEGSISDSQGTCGNEKIELNCKGIYKKELPTPGATLLDEDFNNPATSYTYLMLYDGDKLEPAQSMSALAFDKNNTPWNFTIRDNEQSTDFCAGAHSIFATTPGTSNDWMSTVQLQIPSKKYVLSFDSQSYKKNCSDRLKVYILQTDDEYNFLNASVVERIQSEGDLVYDCVETPGADEELLLGDWKHNRISLDKYAGKNIYIAFVNNNTDQSILFVDNIKVAFEGVFSIGNETQASVVNESETEVKGFVEIISNEEGAEFDSVNLVLHDNDNDKIIDEKNYTGLNLKKGDRLSFAFDNKLPLEKGKVSNYSISATIKDDVVTVNSTVKNLAFVPNKKVVLEEGTGLWCGNCPTGMIAIDNINKSYPNNFIPIAVHSNSGGADPYNFGNYIGQLGLTAFPMGRINRSTDAYSPLYRDLSTNKYSFTSETKDQSFTDIFLKEIEKETEIGIDMVSATYNTNLNKINIKANVTPAIDMVNANYRIFSVVLEDGLLGVQSNYMYAEQDPIFGEWGAGGKYGKSSPLVTVNHVARAMLSNSIDGLSGLIPSVLQASTAYPIDIIEAMPSTVSKMANASVVCCIINANTGAIVNANQIKFTDISGVNAVDADSNNIVAYAQNKDVVVTFGSDADAVVELYNIDGTLVNKVSVNVLSGESVRIDANGATGVLAAKIITDCATVVKKVVVK